MSLELRIKALAEHIANILKNSWWVQVSVWATNNLTWPWIWIETNWNDFNVWFEDWL